jgi:hypothetical protein
MRLVVRAFTELVEFEGVIYTVRACGRRRDDGRWEGWLEFEPENGSTVLRTPRETTQPRLTDLKYWASGLTAVYIEGAFRRAIDAEPVSQVEIEADVHEIPTYPGPAPSSIRDASVEAADVPIGEASLDPFEAYAAGEDLLRRRLALLDGRDLRGIVRAFELIAPGELDLEALDEGALTEVIVAAVRARLAA